jgi:DNA invertase Pin-like site-specific DNA recombinase
MDAFVEYFGARVEVVRRTAYLLCGAGLYGRNSKGLDKSIDDQLVEGREAAEDNCWPIVAEYSDGVSASRFGRMTRKQWHQLLDDLDWGLLDVIITWEPSRADRDFGDVGGVRGQVPRQGRVDPYHW